MAMLDGEHSVVPISLEPTEVALPLKVIGLRSSPDARTSIFDDINL